MNTTSITFQKNGTIRLNDFDYYGLIGSDFYAVIEEGRIKSFKSKKHTIENGIKLQLKGFGNYKYIKGVLVVEVLTDKGTFIAKHCQGVLLA